MSHGTRYVAIPEGHTGPSSAVEADDLEDALRIARERGTPAQPWRAYRIGAGGTWAPAGPASASPAPSPSPAARRRSRPARTAKRATLSLFDHGADR